MVEAAVLHGRIRWVNEDHVVGAKFLGYRVGIINDRLSRISGVKGTNLPKSLSCIK